MQPNRTTIQTTIRWITVLLFLWACPLYAASPIWAPARLAAIIEEGLTHNQEIQSLQSQIAAFTAESEFAGSLSDPMFGFGIANLPVDSFRLDQEPMTQKQLFISQRFPWFGKLDLKSKQAILNAQRIEFLLADKKRKIAKGIADQYYQLLYIRDSLSVNRQLQEMVRQAVGVAETRYATGRGGQPDIFQGQVEISRLEEERMLLEQKKQMAQSRMLALMNRKQSGRLNRSLPEIGVPEFDLEREKLHQLARHYNPVLKLKETEIDLSNVGVRLARKDAYPDVDVKLAYGQRDESRNGDDRADFFSASVSMNLPVWKKYRQDQKVASSLAQKQSREQSYRNLFAMIPHQVDAILSEIHHNRDAYDLYHEKLIPQTRKWALSALAAYEVGNIEFATMIRSRIRVLQSQLQARRILYDIYKGRAALEVLVGIPITDDVDNRSGE